MSLKRKNKIEMVKIQLVLLLVLKRAIGLKTSYGDAFVKPLVFVDQKYHTLESFVTKTQKIDWNGQNPNLCSL